MCISGRHVHPVELSINIDSGIVEVFQYCTYTHHHIQAATVAHWCTYTHHRIQACSSSLVYIQTYFMVSNFRYKGP